MFLIVIAAHAQVDTNLIQELRLRDTQTHEASWSAEFPSIRRQPEQGQETRTCNFGMDVTDKTWGAGWSCEAIRTRQFVWAEEGTGGWKASDYLPDPDGRLVIFWAKQFVGVATDERTSTLRTLQGHMVSPDSVVEVGNSYHNRYDFSDKSFRHHPTVWQTRMALGRGLADRIGEIVSVEDSGATWTVLATGVSYGEWRLVLEKESLLAREADFTSMDGQVSISIRTSGTTGVYAERGTLTQSRSGTVVSATTLSSSPATIRNFRQQAESTITSTVPEKVIQR